MPRRYRVEVTHSAEREALAILLTLGLGTLLSLCLLGCGKPDTAHQKARLRDLNVILITIDTLRADHVGAYGMSKARTPHLDGLASEGVLFERCIAQTPLTLPAHTTILSGTYPLRHQVRDNGGFIVPSELDLVSEVIKRNGLATSAFVGAYVLDSKWGLSQGFDVYADGFDRTKHGKMSLQNEKRAEEVIAEAEKWLDANREARFFSWIHLFDPHSPYAPPSPFDQYPDQPYRGEVEYTDGEIGRFLSFLRARNLYDKSLIIVTGDHGEALGSHGEREHGFFLYEPSVRVPLIIRAPIVFPVKRIHSLVEHVDIAPTILDALGVEAPQSFQGESLLGLIFGESRAGAPIAYTETFYPRLHYGWSELHALYHEDMKYILAPEEELYRIGRDEEEVENLASDSVLQSQRSAIRERLQDFIEERSAGAVSPSVATLGRRDLQALRALGYAATAAGAPDGDRLADPKAKLGIFNRLDRATDQLNAGNYDQAIAAAKEIVRDEPLLVEAQALIGNALQEKRLLREALESFYRVMELKPDANFTMIDIVTVLINLGEFDRAIDEAERFLEKFPDDPMLYEGLGFAYLFKGDHERALKFLERSANIEDNPVALSKAGEIHAAQGDYERAESMIRAALAINPATKGSNFVLGQIAEARGNADQAVEHYDKELENNPLEYRAAFNVAVILKEKGRYDLAIPYYRKTIAANPSFNVPYFMIANYLYEQNRDLEEAIALSKRGIEAMPRDESALLGYQILTAIYAKLGDRASYDLWLRRANELERTLRK